MVQTALPTLTGADIASPRPKYWSDENLDAVVEKLFPRVVEWLGNDYREAEADKIRAELRDAIDSTFGQLDGYQIAKNLEDRANWDGINSDLVETLEMADVFFYDAHRAAIKAWVERFDIKPTFAVGQSFKLPATWFGHGDKFEKFGDVVATISEINAEQATYTLNCPALGHAKPGQLGIQGTFIVFERLEEFVKESAEAKPEGSEDGEN